MSLLTEIVATFNNLRETLEKPMVTTFAQMMGKTDDIECAKRIIDRLTGNPEGLHWIAQAVAGARVIEDRLESAEQSSGLMDANPSGSGLMDHGVHGIISDNDDEYGMGNSGGVR